MRAHVCAIIFNEMQWNLSKFLFMYKFRNKMNALQWVHSLNPSRFACSMHCTCWGKKGLLRLWIVINVVNHALNLLFIFWLLCIRIIDFFSNFINLSKKKERLWKCNFKRDETVYFSPFHLGTNEIILRSIGIGLNYFM